MSRCAPARTPPAPGSSTVSSASSPRSPRTTQWSSTTPGTAGGSCGPTSPRKAAGLSVDYQFIVPFDLEQSEADDFRGITSEELTQLQRRLTDAFRSHGAVPNVTTILDCCHSGYMARNIDFRPKSIDVEQGVFGDAKSFRMLGISEHLQKLGGEVELSGIVTNPDAVRMVACQPEESAYELASTRAAVTGR